MIDHVKKTKVSIKEEITKRCKGKNTLVGSLTKELITSFPHQKGRYITSFLSISTISAERQHHWCGALTPLVLTNNIRLNKPQYNKRK